MLVGNSGEHPSDCKTEGQGESENEQKSLGEPADKNAGNFLGGKTKVDKIPGRLSGLNHKQAETTGKCGHG